MLDTFFKSPIPKYMMVIMLIAAGLIDLIQFGLTYIPIAGWLISTYVTFFAITAFGIWFLSYGTKFGEVKNMLVLGGGSLVEIFPVVNALPAWMATVSLLILFTTPLGKTAESALKGDVQGARTAFRELKQAYNDSKREQQAPQTQAQGTEAQKFTRTQNRPVFHSGYMQRRSVPQAQEKKAA